MKKVTIMLKAIHASGDMDAANDSAASVAVKLRNMRSHQAAQILERGICFKKRNIRCSGDGGTCKKY